MDSWAHLIPRPVPTTPPDRNEVEEASKYHLSRTEIYKHFADDVAYRMLFHKLMVIEVKEVGPQ